MKISFPSFPLKPAGTPPTQPAGTERSATFASSWQRATATAPTAPTAAAGDAAPADAPLDFSNMTKARYVAWGKAEFAKGTITLDDLFQVQIAGGDFDGSVSSDLGQHDFTSFFNDLIENEIRANRAANRDSMVPEYRHLLSMMARDGVNPPQR